MNIMQQSFNAYKQFQIINHIFFYHNNDNNISFVHMLYNIFTDLIKKNTEQKKKRHVVGSKPVKFYLIFFKKK